MTAKPTVSDGLALIGEQMGRQNELLGEVARLMRPREADHIGNVALPTRTDGDFMVRHVPILQLAFKVQVPDQFLELSRELARVHCPCGAIVELLPAEISICHGPEDGDCPRFYLYTGETVRVANTDLLAPLAGVMVDLTVVGEPQPKD